MKHLNYHTSRCLRIQDSRNRERVSTDYTDPNRMINRFTTKKLIEELETKSSVVSCWILAENPLECVKWTYLRERMR